LYIAKYLKLSIHKNIKKMECPVCKSTGINEEAKTCPNCNADLESFKLLKKIEKSSKNRKNTIILLVIIVVLAIAAILLVLFLPSGQTVSKDEKIQMEQQIKNLKNENIQLTSQIADLNKQKETLKIETLQSKQKCEEVTYTVRWGETLYLIAESFYGDGLKYPKIAKDNNIKDPDFILEGQILKIVFD